MREQKLYLYSVQKYPVLRFVAESEGRYPREIYSSTFNLLPGRGIRTFLLPCFMSLKMHVLKIKVVMILAYLSWYKAWTLISSTEEFYPPKEKTNVLVDNSDKLPL